MRVKVGDKWYDVKPGQAIMVELTAHDKARISGMAPKATKYAVFDEEDDRGVGEQLHWIEGDF